MRTVDDKVLETLRALKEPEIFVPRPLKKEKMLAVAALAKTVYMPPSTWERLHKEAKEALKEKVRILSMRGRKTSIDLGTLRDIIALRKAGASVREISRATGIPKSTVHYLLTKVRKVGDFILQ